MLQYHTIISVERLVYSNMPWKWKVYFTVRPFTKIFTLALASCACTRCFTTDSWESLAPKNPKHPAFLSGSGEGCQHHTPIRSWGCCKYLFLTLSFKFFFYILCQGRACGGADKYMFLTWYCSLKAKFTFSVRVFFFIINRYSSLF